MTDYQEKIIKVLKGMEAEFKSFSTIVDLPTGSGKTLIAAEYVLNHVLRDGNKVLWLQSVTVDPLTHERVNQKNKEERTIAKGDFPAIIDPETWYKVQEIIDSRINPNLVASNGKPVMRGKATSKDIYCQKMRCGCGRKFKKDKGRVDGTATYKCYEAVDDGSQEARAERSKILNDDCCVDGIIDWKLDLFTLKVFDYLSCNINEVKTQLIDIIDKSFVSSSQMGYSIEDKLRLEAEIKKLKDKMKRYFDFLGDGIISKEEYASSKQEIEESISKIELKLKQFEKCEIDDKEKEKALTAVRKFVDERLKFPTFNGDVYAVPDKHIEVFVNSIKARANNVFEYNIRVNPNAKAESPLIVPDDEYIPSVHPAVKKLDNSGAILIGELEVGYAEAKAYANKLRRKVRRVHWEIPAKIKVYANI